MFMRVNSKCAHQVRPPLERDHPAELKCLLCYSQPGCLTLA